MNRIAKRTFARAAVCGFLLAATASFLPFGASCEDLHDHVLRLHVVAGSDSPEDQAVKLKVRDAVLEEAAKWYGNAETMEEASTALCLRLETIQKAAQRALEENGCREKAAVRMTDMYFPTREYEAFTLPAGVYRTLRVTLGEGRGQNWWCVVFPALCLPAAERREDVLAALPAAERDLVEHPQKYAVRWKTAELYEKLRERFSSNASTAPGR